MKVVNDQFSRQSKGYKKYRPVYPVELYNDILAHVKNRRSCWDCGTGNGQVAITLSDKFENVYATDISQNQLANAALRANIEYSVQRAEKTNFNDGHFDLVTVGQAAHWFDFDVFNKEVKRVLKPGGIVSIWGYGLLKIESTIDNIIDHFYTEVIGSYWNAERRHVDNRYQSINFEFDEIDMSEERSIITQWTISELEGYLNTWSSVQNYIQANQGQNPVPETIGEISKHWADGVFKEVRFPIFMRTGSI